MTPTADIQTSMPVEQDRDFIAALKRNDAAAFERMVREHAPRMLATAQRLLHNESDAHDAVQDALISAFKAIGSFHGESTLGTWLHRIVINAALMKLRKRRQSAEIAFDDLLPSFHSDGHRRDPLPAWDLPCETPLEQQELRELLRRRIEQLPCDFRTVILLRDVESLSTAATAEVLGIKECTVKVRLHRARMMLRTLLERDFAQGNQPA